MTFTKNFKNALRMFRLDEKAISELSTEKDAGWWGILFIIIAGLCFGISMTIVNPSAILFIIGAPLLMLITTFIGIGIFFFLAKLVGGKGTFHNFYRSYSHMYIYNWIAIVPFVGPFISSLIGVWQVIVAIYVTKNTMHLNLGKSAAVVLVPIVILMLFVFLAAVAGLIIFLKFFLTMVQPAVLNL